MTHDLSNYWEKRKGMAYYATAIGWILGAGPAQRIVDVGSANTPLVMHGLFRQRHTVNLSATPPLDGVEQHVGSFLDVALPPCDVVLCLQVLEHLSDAEVEPFARKLLATGRRVLVSVPYQWPKGFCTFHKQDPVDEAKVAGWFGKAPIWSSFIADEHVRYMAEFQGEAVMSEAFKPDYVHAKRTICEVHREVYRELMQRDPGDPLLDKLTEAFAMGKKMNNKLRQYKHNYDDGWWAENREAGGSIDD